MEKRSRSPNYPSLSLKEAVEKVRSLHQAIGQQPAPRETIAIGMGYRGVSGASSAAISALKKFGLLEGRGDDINVTNRAMAILHPHSSEEQKDALKAAASEPELFAELADRFPGKPVKDELLRNYLLRNKFNPNAVEAAISAYKETMEFVGGFGGAAEPSSSASSTEPKAETGLPETGGAIAKEAEVSLKEAERQLGRWDFEDGGYVKIVASPEVDTEEALDMVQTLMELRRKELSRKRAAQEQKPVASGGPED